jgi:serine/threonine protein kinase/beta-lactam-binding protein with PASTA domain
MANNNLIAGRYEVYQHLGQGGMADVFLATDRILNRRVAIKILRAELSTDPKSVIRFEREAQAATALSHPNIVEIYDVGEYKGHHYIVMEYCPGKTLKKMIKDRGPLLKEEAVDIMKQLVSATAEAHRRGIIHRDIKPQNVMVTADGSVKMLDFGIALAKGSIQLTQANNVMGSVHYLAPELAKGQPASPQSDIYALGVVLYEMLVGDVPFKAESAVQVALKQMHDDMPSVREQNPTVPQALENVVIRATAKDPKQRYASCEEMLKDVETCLSPSRAREPKLRLGYRAAEKTEAGRTGAGGRTAPGRTASSRTGTTHTTSSGSGRRVSHAAVSRKQKKSVLFYILIVLLIALGAASVFVALSLSGVLEPAVTTVAVPDVLGMTLTDAKNTATDNSLVLDTSNVTYQLTTDTEKGLIIDVEPEVGTEVEKGSRITVVVSSGIGVTVKDYTGWKISDAQSDLSQYTYMTVETQEEDSEEADPGIVIRQELLEPGQMFNPDISNTIRLVYVSYPTVVIPDDLVGKPLEDAVAELEAMGVQVLTSNLDFSGLSDQEIANLQTGVVISSDPEGGSTFTLSDENYVTLYYY